MSLHVRWYRLIYNDQFVGYERVEPRDTGDGLVVEQRRCRLLRTQGCVVEVEEIRLDTYDFQGCLLRVEHISRNRGGEVRHRWECEGSTLRDVQGKSVGEWSCPPQYPPTLHRRVLAEAVVTLWNFEPTLVAAFETQMRLREKTSEGFKVDNDFGDPDVASVLSFDHEGFLLEETSSFPSFRAVKRRCGEDVLAEFESLKANPPKDDVSSVAVSKSYSFPDVALAQELELELRGEAPSERLLESLRIYAEVVSFPASGEKGATHLRRRAISAFELQGAKEAAFWLGSDEFVQPDDPELARIVRGVLGHELYDAARLAPEDVRLGDLTAPLSRWAGLFFTGGAGGSFTSTSALLRAENPSGDCGNTALIQIAAFRHLGIPARMAYGIAIMAGSHSGHAWLEVHHGGRWHGVDLLPGGRVGATHLRLLVPDSSCYMKDIFVALVWLRGVSWRPLRAIDRRGRVISFSEEDPFDELDGEVYRNRLWRLQARAPRGFRWESSPSSVADSLRVLGEGGNVVEISLRELPWSHGDLLVRRRMNEGWKLLDDGLLCSPEGTRLMRCFEDCLLTLQGEESCLRVLARAFVRQDDAS